MADAQTFVLFCLASLALLVVPGPAVFYIVTRSIADGRRAGAISMLGIETGGLVHVAAAALGLSALLASSAVAFAVLKYWERDTSSISASVNCCDPWLACTFQGSGQSPRPGCSGRAC